MGTRNLTVVKVDGKTKIAQYGQWDGYPTGQGQTIADFLKDVNLKKFRKQVLSLGLYTQKEMNDAVKEAGGDPDDEWISCDIAQKRDNKYPAMSRDTGARILELVHKGEIKKVILAEDFKNDTTWCEYWYEIDLDKKTVMMNGGKKHTFKEWTRKGKMKQLEK